MTLTPQSAGLMVGTALFAWLTASIAQEPAPSRPGNTSSARRPPAVTTSVPRAERLHERVTRPPLPERGRNPFVFGSRAPRPDIGRERIDDADVDQATPPPMAMPVEPALPVFKLSGIASNMEDGKAVLTAIVIDNGTMVFVKAGDKLSNGYSVVRVDDLSVTLADAAGVTQTLRLP